MTRYELQNAARSQHNSAINYLPETIRKSCQGETKEEQVSHQRFRIYTVYRNLERVEVAQVETNSNIIALTLSETLISYEYDH